MKRWYFGNALECSDSENVDLKPLLSSLQFAISLSSNNTCTSIVMADKGRVHGPSQGVARL